MSRPTSLEDDPIEALAEACLHAEEAYEALDPSVSEEEEKRLEDTMEQAAERLIAHRTTTPLGILRKLEHLAPVESLERDIGDNPRLAAARIVLGLISDLKESLGVQ